MFFFFLFVDGVCFVFFFFSSRRRHTRCSRDWSSDVCSSDLWPYDVSWNWGAGSGVSDGRVIGVQLGGQWTDGTGSTENALFVDGRLHKISEELRWDYDTSDFLRPWRIRGANLDLTFVPFYDKVTRTNLGI